MTTGQCLGKGIVWSCKSTRKWVVAPGGTGHSCSVTRGTGADIRVNMRYIGLILRYEWTKCHFLEVCEVG